MKLLGRAWGWVIVGVLLAPQPAHAFSVSYDQKVTMRGQVMTSKVLLKDEQFRIESAVEGMTTYIIKNRSGLYQYVPAQGVAMALTALSPGQGAVQHSEDYLVYLKERNAKRLRAETVDGHPCDVYEFDDPGSHSTTTAWVWTERRFPVKLEMDGVEGRVTVEISNILLGAGIDESVFQLPAGVDVVSMGTLMQGAAGVLQQRR